MTPKEEKSFIHDHLQKWTTLKQTVRLSSAQKQAMHSTLSEYANLHSVTSSAIQTGSFTRLSFTTIIFSRAFVAGVLILMLVVGSGVGVTYAAGNSLPGQPLYAVKVDVAEPIQGALITSATGKADWQNELAERRLSEATTLAAQNDLASSTQTYLAEQASLHIAQSQQDSSMLAESGNTDAALAVRSDLEARLSAHSQLLALLDARLSANGDATTTSEVAQLLESVSQARVAVSLSREASEAALASGETSQSTGTTSPIAIRTSVSTTASTTPGDRAGIAFVTAQNTARRTEELNLFIQSATQLGLLPEASTTASTTELLHFRHKKDPSSVGSTSPTTSEATTSGAAVVSATSTPGLDLGL
jgi:hypothetical protein